MFQIVKAHDDRDKEGIEAETDESLHLELPARGRENSGKGMRLLFS